MASQGFLAIRRLVNRPDPSGGWPCGIPAMGSTADVLVYITNKGQLEKKNWVNVGVVLMPATSTSSRVATWTLHRARPATS